MPKELLVNINSAVNKGISDIVTTNSEVNSIVTLVDASIKGFTPTGGSVDLSDSLKNYDAVAVEAAAYATDSHFYLNTAYIPKPIYGSLTELGMTYRSYLLDVFVGDSVVKRIGLGFVSDSQATVWVGQDIGSNTDKLGIRNIYGIKYKTPSLPVYSADETPVAIWVNGKTVYRRVVELGGNHLDSVGLTKIPHNIPIETVVNYQCMVYNDIGVHALLSYVNNGAYVGHTVDPINLNITNNIEILGMNIRLIIDYTKR